jgi:DNA-binding transcriptional MerR regulator
VAPKLYKAAEVCDMAQLQPYVLRSWEKEFPGIGVQKSLESPRLYRQSDVEQVLKIKQLVFVEGLTLAGARRRLEEDAPPASKVSDSEVAEVLDALASDARTRITNVRDGLRSILKLLSNAPGTVVLVDDDYQLAPPPSAEGFGGAGRAKKASNGNARAAATSSKSRRAATKTRNTKFQRPGSKVQVRRTRT